MADVAKKTSTVQQTVSSPHTPNGTSPLCELTTTQSGSFSDLSLPHEDDDTSLQDLIDSELALRIARSPSPPARGDVNTRFILEERNHSFQTYTGNDTFFFSTLEDSPPSNGEAAGATSPEEFPPSPPGSDSSPRCLPQSLAAFDPFTTTIDTESSPSADSELVCMAGELASPLDPPPGGVLLDFSEGDLPDDIGPYQTDTNPSRVVENGTLLDLSEGTPQELVGAFPEEVADDFLDPFGSSYREGSVTPDERQQGVDFLDECSLPDLVSPASSTTNLDDDAAGVVNNSMSSDDVNNPSSVVECCVVTPNVRSPGAVLIPEIDVIPPDDDDQVDEDLDMYVSSGYGVADDAEGDENEWTTVAEAVGSPEEETPPIQQPEVAVNGADTPTFVSSCSESDLSTEMVTEKKSKKKRSEGGEVTKTKKTKKNKKSDSEKENISVLTNGCAPLTHNTRDLDQHSTQKVEETEPPTSPGTDPAPPDDDFSNVSVKVLKSAFSNHVQTQPSKESLKEFDEDILYCGPIKSLKQTFCSEANKTFDKRENFDGKERIATGVSIKDLRRSFGDLTNLVDSDEVDQVVFETQSDQNIGARQASECRSRSPPIHVSRSTGKLNLGWKACSLGDLRGVSDSFQPPSIPSARNSDMEEAIVETGISVRALRANYCNQAHLKEELEAPPWKIQPVESKSSFSKFDQLSKKSSILHVRSSDASKAQKQFNQANMPLYSLLDQCEDSTASTPEQTSNCKSCGKQVFQMEQVKAERAVWHKNCFRCKECNKQLTLDIYSSHEGQLYCKPHFRELFKPKAVVEDEKEIPRRRRHEMIIRESQPIELPPGVVRASDKPDLGLEECSSLNVKSRFQVFEKGVDAQDTDLERSPSNVNVKRSPSILSKLARFQAKGMDIGVTDDSLNGIPYEETSSSSEEEEEEEEEGEETGDVVRSSRKHKERPVSFGKMEDMKCREQQSRTQLLEDIRSRWESGTTHRKEELREERKHEISNIRSRLFMGHQGKMKEMYEQAVQDSERAIQKKGVDIAKSENARNLKEKFERGEILPDDDEDRGKEDPGKRAKDEDLSVFEAGISKKSRSLFLELDATAAKTQQAAPLLMSPIKSPAPVREDSRKLFLSRQASEDVVRASDTIEDVQVETDEVSSKFKFFETFKPQEKQKKQFRITPPREGQVKAEVPDQEIYRDPTVVRCEDKQQDEEEVVRSHTTSKMLSLFRQLEENATKEDMPEGPKPLKRFTPPPDYTHESESSEEESETEDEEEEEDEEETINPNLVRASDKIEDEFLKQSQNAARAKVLRAKFERWEEKENKANAALVTEQQQQQQQNGLDGDHIEQASIDTTKSLRARFESMKSETQQPKEKPRPKVNRFVEIQTNYAEFCSSCEKVVYPLEKVETGGKIFHKQCFRCQQCNCILRMETYTLNGGKPYCLPHFKQLFIAKGNYDEGFGLDQHKRKWNNVTRNEEDILLNGINDEHIQ